MKKHFKNTKTSLKTVRKINLSTVRKENLHNRIERSRNRMAYRRATNHSPKATIRDFMYKEYLDLMFFGTGACRSIEKECSSGIFNVLKRDGKI